jgi:hypothetical protein
MPSHDLGPRKQTAHYSNFYASDAQQSTLDQWSSVIHEGTISYWNGLQFHWCDEVAHWACCWVRFNGIEIVHVLLSSIISFHQRSLCHVWGDACINATDLDIVVGDIPFSANINDIWSLGLIGALCCSFFFTVGINKALEWYVFSTLPNS